MRGKVVALRLFRLGHLPPALYQSELLATRGIPILAVEFGNCAEAQTLVPGLVPRIRLQARWTRWLFRPLVPAAIFLSAVLWLVGRVVRGDRPSLVIAHGLQEQAAAWLLWLVTRTRYAVDVHEVYERGDLSGWNKAWFWTERPALRGARFLIFPERERMALYKDRYGLRQPLFLTFNCPPLRERFRASAKDAPAGNFQLLYLGGIGRSNALEIVVEALAQAPGVTLLLAGWGEADYLNELRALAVSRNVSERVKFLGPVENRWRYLDSCDATYCVYRPLWLRLRHAATASNKLMEAIAAGAPVICGRDAGFQEIVEGEGVGICLDELTPDAVASSLRKLVESPELRASMREKALALHRTSFHYEAQFAPALEQIRRLTGMISTVDIRLLEPRFE